MLKRYRVVVRAVGTRCIEITAASKATTTVPAAGPKSNAVVNVNTSEIEKLIGTAGIRSIKWPLTTVRMASATHRRSGGLVMICHTDSAKTSMPTAITAQT